MHSATGRRRASWSSTPRSRRVTTTSNCATSTSSSATRARRSCSNGPPTPWPMTSGTIIGTKLATQFSNNIRNDFGFLEQFAEDGGRDAARVGLPPERADGLPRGVSDGRRAHHGAPRGDAASSAADVRRFWLHQANLKMNQLIAKGVLGRLPTDDEAPTVLDEYANTSSAGSIIAFHEHRADLARRRRRRDLLVRRRLLRRQRHRPPPLSPSNPRLRQDFRGTPLGNPDANECWSCAQAGRVEAARIGWMPAIIETRGLGDGVPVDQGARRARPVRAVRRHRPGRSERRRQDDVDLLDPGPVESDRPARSRCSASIPARTGRPCGR